MASASAMKVAACSAPGGKAWSAAGGGARGEQGRHPAPTGAAGQWLAREAPEVVSLHGLKPRAAPQSPCMPPTGVCPLLRGLLQGAAYGSERPLRGDEFRTANVGSGSGARLRALEKQSPERRGPPRAKSNDRGTSHSRHSRERRSPALTTACCQTARVDWLATAGRNRCTAVIRRRRATLQRIGLPAFPPPLDRPKAAVVAASSSTSCLLSTRLAKVDDRSVSTSCAICDSSEAEGSARRGRER